ncbi:OmpA family protein [bacterium]|nr:OmpA family protein [bacterium]MBU1985241.1 OmpA family protein [bacterium]
MNEPRTILAIASLLSGVVLLLIGVIRLSGGRSARRARGRDLLTLTYGALFAAAGMILLARSEIRPIRSRDIVGTPLREDTAAAIPAPDTLPRVREESLPVLPETESLRVEPEPTVTIPEPAVRSPAIPRRQIAAKTTEPADKRLPRETTDQSLLEDQIYLAMMQALQSIEEWFMKYGHPVPVQPEVNLAMRSRTAEPQQFEIHFPRVVFEAGTAELHPESAKALKHLAEKLSRLSSPVSVEIQARVDSLGPEPFNYLLTQARVEVIRDMLVHEGVDTHRLIATALGSQGEDSTITGSQIRFVLRP